VKRQTSNGKGGLAVAGDLPAPDAQLLLAHALNRSRTWVLAHPEYAPTPDESSAYHSLLARALAGEPIPYLIGEREFFTLDFAVTPAVLIPRPETELLVEKALAWLEDRRLTADRRPLRTAVGRRRSGGVLAADVGTGSGCIAVALAHFSPDLQVAAIDVSPEALVVARANAGAHGVGDRIHFYRGDLLDPLPEPAQLICANLPYIPTSTLNALLALKPEPRLALDGGPDGLGLIRRMLSQAPAKLSPGGALYLEIEASQGPAALALARAAFPTAAITLFQDLARLDRLIEVLT